ncbi:MAG TPA: OmpA family protein [Longimicrobium sp.]|jgi:peptidoglycan-associated lipoprotein|uniref:OmpA family protein n=1 Tax=Longimicrobium sp. TaxID=2029185 RepID=UPI002ED9E951
MTVRSAVVLALVPLLALGACKKKQPVVSPEPDTTTATAGVDEAARADSIRQAEERRRAAAAEEAAERDRVERERIARETAGAREALTEIVFFEYDSNDITERAAEILRLKAAVLQANPGVRLRIEGHADQRGSTEYNLALGQRRAEAVRTWLANYGIDADRFTPVSMGKERPLVEGDGEDAYARNRRAEFAIAGGEVRVVPQELR